MRLTQETRDRAQESDVVDSAYRGGGVAGTGRGERKRKPLRLPAELWDQVAELQSQLQRSFPQRYVTLNSTIEFVLRSAIADYTQDE